MDIDATFLPVAVELIDQVFPTPIVYHRDGGSTYDPITGDVTPSMVDFNISAGVLSRKRIESGDTGEDYQLSLWIHHDATGLPHLPTTSDRFTYDGRTWKVISVDPTYSSAALIASKVTGRAV